MTDYVETAKILLSNILVTLFIAAMVIPWGIGVVQILRWMV